jgi:hypothetical protein
VGRPDFTTPFIPMLSQLDNLAVLTLQMVPVSHVLLQSIGRLKRLEELFILNMRRVPEVDKQEPVFGLHETPFPALRQLALHNIDGIDNLLQDALCVLGGAPTLRTILVNDSKWLHRLLPLITPQLISLCGNLTFVTPGAFRRFIKGHAALQNLTIYFLDVEAQRSYLNIDLDPVDLPDLRSFGGPFALVPKVIGHRPVTKLASPRHMLLDSEPVTFLPSTRESVFHFAHMIRHSLDMVQDEAWGALKSIGGGISQLFVRVNDASESTLSQIGLCFPNLVHLQLEVPVRLACSCQYIVWLSQPFTAFEER